MIIDTLVLLWEAETKPLQQGAKKAEKTVKDVEHAIISANDVSAKLGAQLERLAIKAGETVAGLFAIHHISQEVFHAAQNALELKKLSDATGDSMQDIAAWGHAVVETGGTAQDLQNSLKNLHKGMTDLALTGDSSLLPVMNYLGIGMGKLVDGSRKARPATELLLDLADSFAKIGDKSKAIDLGERIGIDQGTVMMLMQGRNSVEELLEKKKELGALDAKNAEMALKFNVVMDETNARMEHLYMAIGSAVLPVFNLLAKTFGTVIEFFAEHKPFLYALLIGLAVLLWNLVAPLIAGAASFLVMAAPIIGLIALFAALATGLALLADDLWNFLEGNESVLGHVVESWENFKSYLMGIWNSISSAIGDFWESLQPPEWLMDMFGTVGDLFGKAASYIQTAASSPINNETSTSIVGDSMRQNNYDIKATATINTQATDATGISKQVGSTLGEQLRSAVGQHDNGLQA